MIRLSLTHLLLAAVGTTMLHAQTSPVGTVQPSIFQESSTIALASPFGRDLLFEARPALHLYAFNQFGDKVWQKSGRRDEAKRLPRIAMATGISFLPEIRMSTDRSSPVRTPSYRIRVTQQALWMKRDYALKERYRITGFKLTAFSHYSNGQSGCRLRGYAPVLQATGDSACVPVDAAVAARSEPNYDNGDFSTSYFALAFDQRFGVAAVREDPIRVAWEYGVEYQVHPVGLRPGGTDTEQARTYGVHEVNGRIAWERRLAPFSAGAGVIRASALAVARFGPDATPITRSELEVSYIFDRLSSFGVYARHHAGFDYYNIRYTDTRPFVSVGLRFDPDRLDRLPSR